MESLRLYSNEIVFRGHPDKVCDQISGAILKECIKQDKNTHAGIEVVGGKDKIFITGEISTNANYNVEEIANRVLRDIGYSTNYEIINNIGMQSSEINQGVELVDDIGAGDQGMMFGYACNDTKELLPTAMIILQKFAKEYDRLRKKDNRFLPDGKCQITAYYEGKKIKKIKDFVVSYQNTELEREETDNILKEIINNIVKEYDLEIENYYVNQTGKFLIGGFDGDAGLTGRKIVVDAYQSFANVGGGCMNGKDPTKVDFSASHKAREMAKEILLKNDLEWCEVQLSYVIGKAEPLGIYINSNIGNIEVDKKYYNDCKPKNIIKDLNMLELDYEKLAMFGHYTN